METSGLGMSSLDPMFPNHEVEWKSAREDSTIAYGVLLRRISNVEPEAPFPPGTYFKLHGELWFQPFDGSPPFRPRAPNATVPQGLSTNYSSRASTHTVAKSSGPLTQTHTLSSSVCHSSRSSTHSHKHVPPVAGRAHKSLVGTNSAVRACSSSGRSSSTAADPDLPRCYLTSYAHPHAQTRGIVQAL
eukprot:GHVR01161632.1.p1 GENE.GHVR01161632.1~~GHVR01161632.1.p1  ORF type:complete len:188 (+),score=13.83 GHVR01161632.1:861-1424(+)